MNTHSLTSYLRGGAVALGLGALLLTAGCGGSGSSSSADSDLLSLNMDLPASLTGGQTVGTPRGITARAVGASKLITTRSSDAEPCFYNGVEDDDLFRNGYRMTKFMVSAVATWTCVTDVIIELAETIPQTGEIVEGDNDLNAANYDADEPTHYSVTEDSATQTTVRLYYGYDRAVPPTSGDNEDFFISWNTAENGDVSGRLIVDGSAIDPMNRDPEDPIAMRIDFDYTEMAKTADMFLQFDSGNPWAEGFRIEVVRDLTASPLGQVFTARGLMAMNAQFMPVTGITEVPELRMYTVSDRLGEGAAIAEFVDISLPLEIDATTGDHLGNYLFDKTDIYFFDADQTSAEPWDWVEKSITDSQYRGERNLVGVTTADIITWLGLPLSYFAGNECNNIGDDCTTLLNAIFTDGFADQEQNQGADPMDWRSAAIVSPDYLTSVYPNGSDWTGAFDLVFTP